MPPHEPHGEPLAAATVEHTHQNLDSTRMSRTKWILTIVGIVIVLLILWRIFSGPGKSNDFGNDADEAVPVTVVPAAPQNVPVYLTS